METIHRRIAEIALSAAGDAGFALASGYAVRAHGMGDRPSGDVDLFTDWQRRAEFPAAASSNTDAASGNRGASAANRAAITPTSLSSTAPSVSNRSTMESAINLALSVPTGFYRS